MNYDYTKQNIIDAVMKNQTEQEINKLTNIIKEKIGVISFNNISKELWLINFTINQTINKMAEYIYLLEKEIIRKNQIIKDKLELNNEM